jgi:hypothetical protein
MLALLERRPGLFHVETDSSHMLPEALTELLQHELDVLIVNGGDGTVQYAASELLGNRDLGRLPHIAPLRGGRTNMTAKDLGAQRDPLKGLSDVIDAADAGRLPELFVHRPIVKVSSTGRPVQYGMFFGVGVIHRAISLVHRTFPPERQGALGATLVTGALAAKLLVRPTDGILTPDKVQVVLDGGESYGGEFYLLIATSLGKLFAGLNPYWGEGPGGVRFTSISSQIKRLARNLPGIVRGRPGPLVTQENGYRSHNAEQIELHIDCGFTVDGEIFKPVPDEVITLSADRRITFIRA